MELVAQGAHIALAEHLRELLGPERQVLSGAHPRAGLATEPRVGELLDQSGEPAGMALDERGGEIQERVTPLAARGLASETTKYLIEKPMVTFSVELDAGSP
jgi:hypothetical protein